MGLCVLIPRNSQKRGAPERGSRWSRASTMLKFKDIWGGGVVHDGQLPTFDAESKSAKIPKSSRGGGGCMTTNFQLLMLSPNLLKSQSLVGGWGGEGKNSTSNF